MFLFSVNLILLSSYLLQEVLTFHPSYLQQTRRVASRRFLSREDFQITSDKRIIDFVTAVRGPIKEVELFVPKGVNFQPPVRNELFLSDHLVRVKFRETDSPADTPDADHDTGTESSEVNLNSIDKTTWPCEWDDGTSILDAWILPKGVQWPTLHKELVDKQNNAVGRQVLFSRTATQCVSRDEFTIKALRNGKEVGWIGLPGIGKTASMNNILLHFIRNMDEEGWPSNVLLKLSSNVFWFSLIEDKANKEQKVLVEKAKCKSFSEFEIFSNDMVTEFNLLGEKTSDYVVFVELMEDENDPKLYLPYLVSTSSREVDSVTLKTHYKAGLPLLLCDPPSWPELFLMREVLSLANEQEPKENRVDFISAEDFLIGFKEVGGIPRILLSSAAQDLIEQRINDIKLRTSEFFTLASKLSIYDVPGYMKFYAAPYVIKGNKTPRKGTLIATFRFLSDNIASLIGSKVKLPEQYLALKTHGLSYQAFESLILHALFLSRDPEYSSNFPVEQTFEAMKMKEVPIAEKNQAEIVLSTLRNRASKLSEEIKELVKLISPMVKKNESNSTFSLMNLQILEKTLLDGIKKVESTKTSQDGEDAKAKKFKQLKLVLEEGVKTLTRVEFRAEANEDKKVKKHKKITASLKKKLSILLDSEVYRGDIIRDGYFGSEKVKSELIENGVVKCTKLKTFDTQYLKERVENLLDNYVYQCVLVNGVLYDFLAVNHVTKTVYMFQVTDKSTKEHATRAETMLDVMRALGMLEGKGKEYKIVYIFITSSLEPKNEKLVFTREDMKESDYAIIRDRIKNGFVLRF